MEGADAAYELITRKVHGSSAIPLKKGETPNIKNIVVDRFAEASEELTIRKARRIDEAEGFVIS